MSDVKKLEMRDIKGSEFFKISKITSKLGLDIKAITSTFKKTKSDIKGLYRDETGSYKVLEDKGETRELNVAELEVLTEEQVEFLSNLGEVVYSEVFVKLHLVEKELRELLADLCSCKVADIDNVPFAEFLKLLKILVMDKGFTSFFQSVKA